MCTARCEREPGRSSGPCAGPHDRRGRGTPTASIAAPPAPAALALHSTGAGWPSEGDEREPDAWMSCFQAQNTLLPSHAPRRAPWGTRAAACPLSAFFFPFLLAPTASRLRLPDEYLKAWILCSLMNIDGCWLPATVAVLLQALAAGLAGWDRHRQGFRQGCLDGRRQLQGPSLPHRTMSPAVLRTLRLGPKNAPLLPKIAGLEPSHH